MKSAVTHFLIGLAMGAANVIPGVSGGTVAFITGIYERLINALKSFGAESLRLLLKREWRRLIAHVDALFLTALAAGVVVSFLSLARVLAWALETHERLVFAFFFGLILASIFSVARMVGRWGGGTWIALAAGCGIALAMAFLTPASENASIPYLFLCGVAAMCSMIIPGISGSFVVLLMGNYALLLRAVNERDIGLLIPVALGAVLGLMALARVLSWLFRRFHDVAVALIAGFVAGSLAVIWPWKVVAETSVFEIGGVTKEKILSYRWELPDASEATLASVALMVVGALVIVAMELATADKDK